MRLVCLPLCGETEEIVEDVISSTVRETIEQRALWDVMCIFVAEVDNLWCLCSMRYTFKPRRNTLVPCVNWLCGRKCS